LQNFNICKIWILSLWFTVRILLIFDETLHSLLGQKNTVHQRHYPIIPSPILPQLFTLVMFFLWLGANTTVTRPVD